MTHTVKWINMARLVAFATAFVMLLLTLSGCGSLTLDGYLTTGDYEHGDRTAVATLDGKDVPFELYRYFYRSHLDGAKAEGLENPEAEAAVLAEASVRHYFTVMTLAKEYGLELSEEALDSVKASMDEQEALYDDRESYLEVLDSYYMSEELCYNLLLNSTLEGILFDYMSEEASGVIDSTDAVVEKDIRENFFAAIQFYVRVKEGEDSATVKADFEAYVQEKDLENLSDREFEKLAKTESDDEQGLRYFTKGYSYEFFEQAVSGMKEGETSTVIESSMGFHMIRRVALDDAYIDEHFEELRYDSITRRYNEILTEKEAGCLFVKTDAFEALEDQL